MKYFYFHVIAILTLIGAIIFFVDAPLSFTIIIVLALFAVAAVKMIKNPEFGLALVGFFLSFERIPSVEISGLSLKINYILIIALLFIFVTVKAFEGRLKIPRDPITLLVAIFVLSLTPSLSQAVNFSRSLQVMLFTILMAVVYFTIILVAQNKKAMISALKGVLAGAAVSAIFGLYQFFGDMIGLPNSVTLLKEGYDKGTFGFARVQAGAQEPLYFANYIFIPLFVSLMLLVKDKSEEIVPKWFNVFLVIALMLNFILAISRGAFLAAAVAFAIFLIVQFKKIFRLNVIIPSIIIIATVLLASSLALMRSEPRAMEEYIEHLTVQDRYTGESVVLRLSTANEALNMFRDNIFFGVGLGNFGPVLEGDPSLVPKTGWPIVNNEYLELLSETGIVGFTGFLILIIGIITRGVISVSRSRDEFLKTVQIGLLLALVAVLVQYFTFSTIYIFHIWFLLGLIGAISNIVINNNKDVKKYS